jgi:ABC-2 type transport system ATP-binding protein
MTRLELVRVSGKKLRRVDLSLEGGLHALVGVPDDEASELVAICAGLIRPKRGVVRLNDERPFVSPATRRTVGALLDVEDALEGPTVEAAVALSLALHGVSGSARDLLVSLGLEPFLERRPRSLSASEVRKIAFSIALGLSAPALLVLYEPLAAGLERKVVEARLTDRAVHGAVVLSVMASQRDAAELGARTVEFARVAGKG